MSENEGAHPRHETPEAGSAAEHAARKEALLAELQALATHEEPFQAYRRAQELATAWTGIGDAGPADRDLRARFKAAKETLRARKIQAQELKRAAAAKARDTKTRLLGELGGLPTSDLGFAEARIRLMEAEWKMAGKAGPDEARLAEEWKAGHAGLREALDARRAAVSAPAREPATSVTPPAPAQAAPAASSIAPSVAAPARRPEGSSPAPAAAPVVEGGRKKGFLARLLGR